MDLLQELDQATNIQRETACQLIVAGWNYASPAYWNDNIYMLSENETILLNIDSFGNVTKKIRN